MTRSLDEKTGLILFVEHDSDCDVHNEPAYLSGECNCGAIEVKSINRYSDETSN